MPNKPELLSDYLVMRAVKVGDFDGSFDAGYPLLDSADERLAFVWDEKTANAYVEEGGHLRTDIKTREWELPIIVRRTAVTDIIPLRHKVLRPGLPIEKASFEGDNEPETWHMALFAEDSEWCPRGKVLCCASFVRTEYQQVPAFQLRGMATDGGYKSFGFGRELLTVAEQEIMDATGVSTFWCNARVESIGFYEKLNWMIKSDVFDIPTVGPHKIMAHYIGL